MKNKEKKMRDMATSPLNGTGYTSARSRLTAGLGTALLLLLTGGVPSVRAQGPGPVLSWASALDQTPSRTRTDGSGYAWDRTEYDFGQVALGDTVTTVFRVTARKGSLVLLSAETECGCIWAEFPKRPIRERESAEVKVHYAANSAGNFRKTVHLRFLSGGKEALVVLVTRGTIE